MATTLRVGTTANASAHGNGAATATATVTATDIHPRRRPRDQAGTETTSIADAGPRKVRVPPKRKVFHHHGHLKFRAIAVDRGPGVVCLPLIGIGIGTVPMPLGAHHPRRGLQRRHRRALPDRQRHRIISGVRGLRAFDEIRGVPKSTTAMVLRMAAAAATPTPTRSRCPSQCQLAKQRHRRRAHRHRKGRALRC